MKGISWIFILVLLCAVPTVVWAQENKQEKDDGFNEIIVTATRIDTLAKEIGASTSVISKEEIEKEQKTLVLDLLRRLPSMDVVRNGGLGKTTSVFIRGANSEHTLVLVDGIEMNDPIGTGRSFDFANLTTDNIERIEVVRGPQSTLYGSDAMGGVINIITKRGKGKPSFYVSGEAGSFGTFKESAGLSGSTALVNYSLGISNVDTDGISSAGKKYGNKEKDGYSNTSVSGRLGFVLTEKLDLDLILKYNDAASDIDNAGGTGGDDPNNVYRTEQLFTRAVAGLSLFNGLWDQKFGISMSEHSRNNNNGKDPAHPNDLTRSSYDSSTKKLDWQNDIYLNKANIITAGVEYEEDEGSSDYYSESVWGPYSSVFDKRIARTVGYYLQDQIKYKDRLFVTMGVRLDEHSKFGSAATYRTTAAYVIGHTGTRLKATYGTGFKSPSLYQLYSQYGDQSLDSETSRGWDAGIEQRFYGGKVSTAATYFRNDFKDLIEYDSGTSKYRNISEARTEGVELYASLRASDTLDLRLGYTYTDTEDKSTGKDLRRRAKNKATASINYRFNEKGNINIGVMHVGARYDMDYTTSPSTLVKLDSYTLMDLAASYDIRDNLRLTARIDNVLDDDYEEAKGYGTPGFAAYAGLRLSF